MWGKSYMATIVSLSPQLSTIDTVVYPTIRDGKVVSMDVSGINLQLAKPQPLASLGEIIDVVDSFSSYFDLHKLRDGAVENQFPEFSADELESFVAGPDLREDQAEALLILAENKEITTSPFIAALEKRTDRKNISTMQLGGMLAGVTMKSHSNVRESPYTNDWFRTSDDSWDRKYYLMDPAYAEAIKRGMERRKDK